MSDVYSIMTLGRGALLAQQKALEVTSNNIANVNTPGYSRQRVNMQANEPLTLQPGQVGTGVKAAEIQRVYDRFLSQQIDDASSNLGRWEAQKGALERVEMVFDESSGYGLNQALSEFWNAWQDLSNNPSGYAERATLLSKSDILSTTFRDIYSTLQQIQKDMDTSIEGTVAEINAISEQIADLNEKISLAELSGLNANDYRDKREILLKELSSEIDITSFEGSDNRVTVFVTGGRPLVENIMSWDLSTEANASGFQDAVWVDKNGVSHNISGNISGGKLKGWMEARDSVISDYLTELDNLAGALISEVNALHSSGFGLDGSSGNNFFRDPPPTPYPAKHIMVDQNILNDSNLVAAADNNGGVWDNRIGDGANAIAIANLQTQLTMGGNTTTFDDFYNSMVNKVGSDVLHAGTNYGHQSAMATQLDNYRESISGVSLDEEMVDLIKFQRAYEAAARLISIADELLESVLEM